MRTRTVVLALLMTAALAGAANAADFGLRGGRYNDTEEAFAGIELVFPLSDSLALAPNIEYVFAPDDYRLGTANLDLTYTFGRGAVKPWLGAGVAWIYARGFGITDTKFGANAIAGVGFGSGSVMPYVQVKQVFTEDSKRELVLGGGLRF